MKNAPVKQVCLLPNKPSGRLAIRVLKDAIKAYPEGGRKLRIRGRAPDRELMPEDEYRHYLHTGSCPMEYATMLGLYIDGGPKETQTIVLREPAPDPNFEAEELLDQILDWCREAEEQPEFLLYDLAKEHDALLSKIYVAIKAHKEGQNDAR